MSVPKIFESEYRFCLILWENEPVKSGRLVELCREKLGWSKATTYTVIKRLSQRGVLKNEDTVVRPRSWTNWWTGSLRGTCPLSWRPSPAARG